MGVQQADASEVSDWYRHGTARRGGKLRHSQRFIIMKRGRAAGAQWRDIIDARNYQKSEVACVTAWLGWECCSTGWGGV
jgi:hypothetical protein